MVNAFPEIHKPVVQEFAGIRMGFQVFVSASDGQ
jgi:hypothetical protein